MFKTHSAAERYIKHIATRTCVLNAQRRRALYKYTATRTLLWSSRPLRCGINRSTMSHGIVYKADQLQEKRPLADLPLPWATDITSLYSHLHPTSWSSQLVFYLVFPLEFLFVFALLGGTLSHSLPPPIYWSPFPSGLRFVSRLRLRAALLPPYSTNFAKASTSSSLVGKSKSFFRLLHGPLRGASGWSEEVGIDSLSPNVPIA